MTISVVNSSTCSHDKWHLFQQYTVVSFNSGQPFFLDLKKKQECKVITIVKIEVNILGTLKKTGDLRQLKNEDWGTQLKVKMLAMLSLF